MTVEKVQFRVLFRVFLMRVVDLELLSADGDPTKLLGQIAALLAGVSFLFCLPLLLNGGGWHETDLWVMEHLFLSTTMLVVGLFSVLSWDSIFPDKRDVLVLAPLPVSPKTIFLAKLAALGSALAVSVLALNVFTGLIWPLLFSSGSILDGIRSYMAYWLATFAAAAFMFFSVLIIQGIASHLLPRQFFLRLSALLQVAACCLFLGIFILEPTAINASVLHVPDVFWLPTYWFWGLFQQLNKTSSSGLSIFFLLAKRAVMALAISIAGASAMLLLSYLRTLRKIAEAPEIVPGMRRVKRRFFQGKILTSAILLFSFRTLLRSRSHRVILSFYFGTGFAIVVAYVSALFAVGRPHHRTASEWTSSPLLAASILMMCVAVGGIRIVSAMPITLRANWIFRMTELRSPSAYLAAIRRTFLVLGVAPVWLSSSVVFFLIWPWRLAMEHLLVLGLIGMILVELSLRGFHKIPFNCAYLPGKGNLQYVFWACAIFLLPTINAGAKIEMQMLGRPFGYSVVVMILGIILAGAMWYTAAVLRAVAYMRFDEVDPPDICSLNLNRD